MTTVYPSGKVEKGGVILYDPSPTYETELHRDLTTPNLLVFGPRGTAKSWSTRWHVHRLCLQFPGYTVLVARLSKPELQRTWLSYLPAEMEQLGGSYNKVDGLATYPNGSTATYAGFANESDAQKSLGMSLNLLVIEEIVLMSWETVAALASCLRAPVDGPTPQLIGLCNPIGPYSRPVKRHFVDKDLTETEEPGYRPDEWKAVPTVAADNGHLDFDAYTRRLSTLSPAKRKAYIDGQWSDAEGAFFPQFDTNRHVITRLPEVNGRSILRHPDIPVYRSYDHGFSDDPAVCLWIAVLPSGQAIVMKEQDWHRTPVAELSQEIIGQSRDMQLAETFCDPTMANGARHGAQSVHDLFEINGVPMTLSVNDRTMPGIHEWLSTTVNGQPRLLFWSEGCPKLIATMQHMVPNPKDMERMKDGNDHWVCALSFFCSSWASGHEPMKAEKPVPSWLLKMQQLESPRVLGASSVRK